MEQLQFSQQSPKPGTTQPLYLSNTKRMLLLCGVDDTGGDLCKHTQDVAPKMVNTPGYGLFLNTTGHSIHNEWPMFLALRMTEFLDGNAAAPPSSSPLPAPTPTAAGTLIAVVQSQVKVDKKIPGNYWAIVTATDGAGKPRPVGADSVFINGARGVTGAKINFAGCGRSEPAPCTGTVKANGFPLARFTAGAEP